MNSFGDTFIEKLAQCLTEGGTFDPYRDRDTALGRLRGSLRAAIVGLGKRHRWIWLEKAKRSGRELAFVFERKEEFEQLYAALGDDQSRNALIEALALRILGPYYVRAAVVTQDYWGRWRGVEKRSLRKRKSIRKPGFPKCNYYELEIEGAPIACHASPFGIATTFLSEQYAYRGNETNIVADPGDVVLDGGGYLGETALYFSQKVGSAGRVYSFEFNHEALGIMRENLALNSDLQKRIKIVERAVWRNSTDEMQFAPMGPGTSLVHNRGLLERNGPNQGTKTISIDDLVKDEGLGKVDFIKLDVEGAESAALEGAAATLRKHHPKLAVAVYHKIEDFVWLPRQISELNPAYRFYLRHAHYDATETVLFARVRG